MAVNLFRFYESILRDEMCLIPGDEEEEMELALDILLASYSVEGLKIADSLNFNLRELRCAYLFLFSTSHSHMVFEALNRLHEENYSELLNLIVSASRTHGTFNITSLGGGPGSDPLGILTFLQDKGFLGSCPLIKVSLVDEYIGWESTFQQVMRRFNNGLVRAQFKTQNLLLPLSTEVQAVLKDTHFLSMVKFVSAISGDKNRAVQSFQRIFSLLQPGTLILIIDNAGGQDFNQVLNWAKRMGLHPVLEPVLHYQFKVPKMQEQGLGRLQYGKRPQSSSTISMVILKKHGSTLSNYIEPVIRFQEPNLHQARTERSNGYLTGSNSCSNNSNLENLPPILNRLLLASDYTNRSNNTSSSNVAPVSSGSTFFGLNSQSTTQNKTNTSSTSSLHGINQKHLSSAQAKPSGSTYSGLNSQPSTQSKITNPSTSSMYQYEGNRTYLGSAQPKVIGSTYSGYNNQFHTQSKTTTPPTSLYKTNQTRFDRTQIQGNFTTYREVRNYPEQPYSQLNSSRRPVTQPRKKESSCCFL